MKWRRIVLFAAEAPYGPDIQYQSHRQTHVIIRHLLRQLSHPSRLSTFASNLRRSVDAARSSLSGDHVSLFLIGDNGAPMLSRLLTEARIRNYIQQ